MNYTLNFPLSGADGKRDWDHGRENCAESDNHYSDNLTHYNSQCDLLLDALLRGEKLTTGYALLKYKIGDLRAHVRDLRKKGIKVLDNKFVNEQGKKTMFKEYYL